jgi:hypothetical protein
MTGRSKGIVVQARPLGEPELGRFRLAVSDRVVVLHHPSGAEDLLMLEAARTPSGDAWLALTLAERLTRTVEGAPIAWADLPASDLDATILRLRQALISDRVRSDVACPARDCRQRIDIDFRIEEYLAHHAPRSLGPRWRGWGVEPLDEAGWFRPADGSVSFRLPTAADLVAVAGHPSAANELARRCLRPVEVPAKQRRRVEAVLEEMAPSLSGDLQGDCPECGASVAVHFDARWFCLRELRDRATFLYQDVDLLARRYHWSESEILSMPRTRRAAYAELARQGMGA